MIHFRHLAPCNRYNQKFAQDSALIHGCVQRRGQLRGNASPMGQTPQQGDAMLLRSQGREISGADAKRSAAHTTLLAGGKPRQQQPYR